MKFKFFNSQKEKHFSDKGLSFVDVLVGTSLVLIVFLGIFGAYQLGLKVVGYSKNKITATALANHELETIRNLPYGDVGIIGGTLPVPEGELESSTTTIINGKEYLIERRIEYVSDDADGSGVLDDCDLDYKVLEVKVSWSGQFNGEVVLGTDVGPKNKVEELSSCMAQPGGILSVEVFDAFGAMIESPLIEIFNPETEALIVFHVPAEGKKDIALATGTYKIVVSKTGLNSARSYGTDEAANPENACHARPHQEVLLGQLTPVSFCIDKISSFGISTLAPWAGDNFNDSFADETKIDEKNNLIVSDNQVSLATDTGGYLSSGYLVSSAVVPGAITSWENFSFSDSEPFDTDIKYQLSYASGSDWYLIPDADLTGNSSGFDASPVDISALDIVKYTQLKIRGDFSTLSTSSTPVLDDWQISWRTSGSTPIPFASFDLRGEKTIGTDVAEDPIYKYSITTSTDATGQITIQGLEWDLYNFSTEGTGLDLTLVDPSPQPVNLVPDVNQLVKLYLAAENSLLITVQNLDTAEPVFGASVRLRNAGLGYDETQFTNSNGQTYFIPLEAATYDIDVENSSYLSTSSVSAVSGDVTNLITIEQIE